MPAGANEACQLSHERGCLAWRGLSPYLSGFDHGGRAVQSESASNARHIAGVGQYLDARTAGGRSLSTAFVMGDDLRLTCRHAHSQEGGNRLAATAQKALLRTADTA
jgi:hypothetical protein